MKRIVSILLTIPTLLTTQGCGKWAKAKPQKAEIIAIPEYPSFSDNVYGLTPARSSVGYGGTMVIMNQDVDPADLADLLQASIDSRKAWAETRRFTEESDFASKYAEGGIYEIALKDMKAELKIFEAEAKAKLEISDEALSTTADSWFDNELELLFPENKSDKDSAQLVLNRYCEAKVWELATNSFFAMNSYSSTPSPMAFCKGFYEDNGFFTADSCKANQAGSNYFSCLWQDGVKKTSFFKEYSEEQKTKLNQLISVENNDAIRDILGIHEPAFTFPSPLYKSRTIGNNKENRDYFSKIILQQGKGSTLCKRVIPDYSELCTAFEKSYSAAQIDSLQMSPFDFISMVEGTNAEKSSLFPLPSRPNTEITTKDILSYLALRQKHQNSELDRLFHIVVEGTKVTKPVISDEVLASKGSTIENLFVGQLYPALEGDDLATFEKRLAQIQTLESDYDQKNKIYENYRELITNTSDQAFQVGYRPNVAHAFLELRMKVSNRDGVLRAYHWVKDSEDVAVLGCLDVSTKQSLTATCQPHPDDKVDASTYVPAKLFRVNEDSGLVEFEVSFDDPEPLGFTKKDRITDPDSILDSFSDLGTEDFLGKTLYFELFPNLVYGHLEILTGKAFLRENGVDLEEAAVSFWDQNL